jgi:hypothetical protein
MKKEVFDLCLRSIDSVLVIVCGCMLKYTQRDRGRDRQTDRLFEKKSILPALLEQVMRMQREKSF